MAILKEPHRFLYLVSWSQMVALLMGCLKGIYRTWCLEWECFPNTLVLEYLGPSLMGLFAETWKVWPCQSKYVSRDGLCGFRVLQHSPQASSAWCLRSKRSALSCSSGYCLCYRFSFPPTVSHTFPGIQSTNKMFLQWVFLVMVLYNFNRKGTKERNTASAT